MEYTPEQLKRAVQLGAVGYGFEKCANVLEIDDLAAFEADYYNPASEFKKHYKRGEDMAAFAIDAKLFELAKSGDIDALHELEERRAQRELDEEDTFTNKFG
jgi:hypothetical protein